MFKIYVIGIGFKLLDNKAKMVIRKSNIVLANIRLKEVFEKYDDFKTSTDKIKVMNNIDKLISFMHEQRRIYLSQNKKSSLIISLLAAGDPMFYGIGKRIISEFSKEFVEIFPDISSVQMAFAKIKESWNDALLISLHRGPNPKKPMNLPYKANDIPRLIKKHRKLAILTDSKNNPNVIAREILKVSLNPDIYVCERLGYLEENLISKEAKLIATMNFKEPNIVIIINKDFDFIF